MYGINPSKEYILPDDEKAAIISHKHGKKKITATIINIKYVTPVSSAFEIANLFFIEMYPPLCMMMNVHKQLTKALK